MGLGVFICSSRPPGEQSPPVSRSPAPRFAHPRCPTAAVEFQKDVNLYYRGGKGINCICIETSSGKGKAWRIANPPISKRL